MEKSVENQMTCAAFARRHGVSKTTVQRWRAAGYLVMVGNKVDVARSEKLLAERPAEYRGGRASGPVANDGTETRDAWIADLVEMKAASPSRVAAIYERIIADMRKLPVDADEFAMGRVHYLHQDELRSAKGIE